MKIKFLITVFALTALSIAFAKIYSDKKAMAAPAPTTVIDNDEMKGWSDASKIAMNMMIRKYGQPEEQTATMAMWKNNGPWKKTVIYAKEFKHDFPMPHTDVMQQWVDYKVPPEKFDELAMFDGSVVCNRTTGEISARCDKEEANFLALNLANDIVKDNKAVNTARDEYAKAIKDLINGSKPEYTQNLKFGAGIGATEDNDKKSEIITADDISKAKKMMEMQKKELDESGMKNNRVK
jgi:hypothetical protein